MFLIVDFDLLLIADDTYVPRDNLRPEALDPVSRPQFPDLQTGETVRPGYDRRAV